jgi:hypothetical protein
MDGGNWWTLATSSLQVAPGPYVAQGGADVVDTPLVDSDAPFVRESRLAATNVRGIPFS